MATSSVHDLPNLDEVASTAVLTLRVCVCGGGGAGGGADGLEVC